MKRRQKFLVLLVVLAVLCGAALVAPLLTPGSQQEPEQEAVTVFSLEPGSITELTWTYEEETLCFGYKDESWYYIQDADFPVDSSILEQMEETLSLLTAQKTVETPEALVNYGLQRPVCTVKVTSGDTTTELLIGDETPVDGLRYLSTGDGKVYLVDSGIYTAFQYGLYDMVSYETVPAMAAVTELSVEAGSQSLHLQYLESSGLAYSDSYVWFAENGGSYRAVDTELTESFLSGITGLSWDSCVNYSADAAALKEYGLADPAVKTMIRYTQETGDGGSQTLTFSLELGARADSNCYARLEGSNMVYLIDGSIADSLLYTTYSELQPDELLLMDWETVETVTVTLDGKKYLFERSLKEVAGEDGSAAQEVVYLLDGQEADLQPVLDTLVSVDTTGYANGAMPERGEVIRFHFERNTLDYAQIELVIYQYDSSTCLVLRDGVPTVFVSRENTVDLVEAINALILD